MVQFDNQYKQVKLKVVYYGPALGGKTSCLQYIHRVTDPARRTKLYALNTASDRTLFFDLLALDLGRVRGYRLTLQLYTVPGQVQYNATRRAVLAGADGVVFVADSQRSQLEESRESLKNLAENLRANGLDPESIPCVLLYNKRDLPDVVSRSELDSTLNPRGLRAFETVATVGQGVMDAFGVIAEATVLAVAERLGLAAQPEALNRLVANVRVALQPFLPKDSGEAVEPAVVLRPANQSASIGQEDLVAEAVRANMTMVDLNTRLERLTADLDRRSSQLRVINEFGREMSLARAPDDIVKAVLDRLLAVLRVSCGSMLLIGERGELVEALRRGTASDPMLQQGTDGTPAAMEVISSRQPLLVRLDEVEPAVVFNTPWMEELQGLGLASAIAVPMLAQDRVMGIITCYADPEHGGFEDTDLELASVLAANAAVALANARAWLSLEELNCSLEDAVAARTRELEEALRTAKALGEELEDRNLQLEAVNTQLRELERLKSDLLSRVAHELNTPVTAIQTATRILSRYDEVPRDTAARFVGIIGQEAARLGDLISAALQAVVLGVAEGPPASTQVPLADLLKRVLAPLKADIAKRSITLQVRVAAGLEELRGDAEQLEAALRAVVRNAVEFNRENGSVTVTARPVRRGAVPFVEVRVEDTGNGIPADNLPHVCDVFWQGGDVLTEKPHGLGLGLAVARRVAENHGGSLEISSEVGKGTTVSFYVPPGAVS